MRILSARWHRLNVLVQLLIIGLVLLAVYATFPKAWTENDLFNNREKATILWILAFLIWGISRKEIRKALFGVLKAVLQTKIVMVLTTMIFYISFVIFLFSKVGFWQTGLMKDTVYWLAGTAFVYLLNVDRITQDEDHFKKTWVDNLKFVLVIEFIVNFYTFSFGVEMFLMPFFFVLGGMSAIAGMKNELEPVKKVVDVALAISGIILVIHAGYGLLNEFNELVTSNNFRAFALPPALTFTYLPFLYFWALLMSYERLFAVIDIFVKKRDQELAKFMKRKVFFLCRMNLRKLDKFAKECTREFRKLRDRNDVLNLLYGFSHRKA